MAGQTDGLLRVFDGLPGLSQFALALLVILLLPRLFERFGLPGLVGLIAGGALLGPHGLHVFDEHHPIFEFFADLGKLLLMFFVGLEIDLGDLRKTWRRSLTFGLMTFALPFVGGVTASVAYGYSTVSAVMVGSLLASHTLLGFPIVKAMGIETRDAVLVTIGATVLTDMLAMLVLALCIPIHMAGFSWQTFGTSVLALVLYVPATVIGLVWVARRALRFFPLPGEGRVAVLLLLIAVAAQAAKTIHLEGIVGAFLAGIAVREAARTAEVEHALDVISKTLFITAFIASTGFLIDFAVFGSTVQHYPGLVLAIVGALVLGKLAAAGMAGRLFGYSRDDTLTVWSLTLPQMAATLAAAVVAFAAVNPSGQRLIDQRMLNAVLVLVVVTAVCGPMLTQRYGRRLQQDH